LYQGRALEWFVENPIFIIFKALPDLLLELHFLFANSLIVDEIRRDFRKQHNCVVIFMFLNWNFLCCITLCLLPKKCSLLFGIAPAFVNEGLFPKK